MRGKGNKKDILGIYYLTSLVFPSLLLVRNNLLHVIKDSGGAAVLAAGVGER